MGKVEERKYGKRKIQERVNCMVENGNNWVNTKLNCKV